MIGLMVTVHDERIAIRALPEESTNRAKKVIATRKELMTLIIKTLTVGLLETKILKNL